MGETRELADFVARTRFADLPGDVVERVRLSTLNIAGCCLGGLETRIGRLHVELAKELGGGNPQATIVGDGARVSVALAAYANASLAFALDYEDMLHLVVHPGYVTVASALAAGEHLGARGRDFVTAVVVGHEVAGRIGLAIQPSPERGAQVFGQAFHTFAAAAAVGKLLGLDADALDVALGVAGTYTPVPSSYKYFGIVEETRPLREVKQGWGWMCLGGVVAALSAARGFRGGRGFLDGPEGYWIMAGSDRCDFARLTAGLGTEWMTRDTEFKLHPSIGTNHPAFWATKQLVEEHGVAAEDVEEIRLTTPWGDRIGDTQPAADVDAQFSLPYTVATTVMREPLGPALYSDEKRRDPTLRRLLARTTVVHDREADRIFFEEQRLLQTVELVLADGRTLRREVEFPRDRPAYGRPEVERKFDELGSRLVDTTRVRALIDRLEELGDVGELAAALGS